MTEEYAKTLFYWFHKHPELSFEETMTTRKITDELRLLDVEMVSTNLKTGVIAVIRGHKPGKKICFRADIDALPVEEKNEVDFASQELGKMHACGHDFHITCALATIDLLQQNKEKWMGEVYVIFQPAEEVAGGAKEVLQSIGEDIFQDIFAYIGIHATPELKSGQLGITAGNVMAAVDRFQVELSGSMTHAAQPYLGNNPIPVLADIVRTIQFQADKYINPLHPHVVTVTHVEAGNTWNVIPERALFEGTIRCFEEEDRKSIRQNIFKIVEKYAEAAEMKAEIEWHEGPGSIQNDAELCELAWIVAQNQKMEPVKFEPAMISDDFSVYLRQEKRSSKGIYLRVGTGIGYPLHHPSFRIDVNVISSISKYLSEFIFNILKKD